MGTPEVLGPYVIYERLGAGGMATVHRAEQIGLAGFRKQIALKRLLPHVAAEPAMLQMFIHEARLASHLRHTNVAQVYDLGKFEDTYFIAMEYVPGPTLTQVMKQCGTASGAMPVSIVLSILGQICDALDHAHNLSDDSGKALGIIHRDVSPANIIVSTVGIVKLIDFGIAKAETGGVQTQTGMVKGKYAYIAPEYTLGRLDRRADLFGLGVIAHELLTTRRLFNASSDFETIKRLREMPIQPPSRWNPQVPADVDDIVMTALQRDPDLRWQSAAAMRTAITNAARSMDHVVTNQQLYEWVEWAFGTKPRSSGDVPLGQAFDTLEDPSTSGSSELTTNHRLELEALGAVADASEPEIPVAPRISANVVRRGAPPPNEFVDEAATVAAAPSIETLIESGRRRSARPSPFDDGGEERSTMPGPRRSAARELASAEEPPTMVDAKAISLDTPRTAKPTREAARKSASLSAPPPLDPARKSAVVIAPAVEAARRKATTIEARPSSMKPVAAPVDREERSTTPMRPLIARPSASFDDGGEERSTVPGPRRSTPHVAPDDPRVPRSLPLGGPVSAMLPTPVPASEFAGPSALTVVATRPPPPSLAVVPTALPLGGPTSDRPTLLAPPPPEATPAMNNKARAIAIPRPLVPDPPSAFAEESGVVIVEAPPAPARRVWPWIALALFVLLAAGAGAYVYFVEGYTLDL